MLTGQRNIVDEVKDYRTRQSCCMGDTFWRWSHNLNYCLMPLLMLGMSTIDMGVRDLHLFTEG